MLGDVHALNDYAEQLERVSRAAVPGWGGTATCHQGEAMVNLGLVEEGMAQIRAGMAALNSIGVRCNLTGALRALADAQIRAGRPEEARATLADVLALVAETDERIWEAELHRLQGELLLTQGDEAGAEASLQRAIQVARRQQARSWELRATMSLGRLWRDQGKTGEARQRLAEIYGWFTEGFDTPDLVEARTLLAELVDDAGLETGRR
jgi:predicted ATPase